MESVIFVGWSDDKLATQAITSLRQTVGPWRAILLEPGEVAEPGTIAMISWSSSRPLGLIPANGHRRGKARGTAAYGFPGVHTRIAPERGVDRKNNAPRGLPDEAQKCTRIVFLKCEHGEPGNCAFEADVLNIGHEVASLLTQLAIPTNLLKEKLHRRKKLAAAT